MGRKYHPIDSNGNLTPRICTLWYRAPELMFSDQPNYDAAVDMWYVSLLPCKLIFLIFQIGLQGAFLQSFC